MITDLMYRIIKISIHAPREGGDYKMGRLV